MFIFSTVYHLILFNTCKSKTFFENSMNQRTEGNTIYNESKHHLLMWCTKKEKMSPVYSPTKYAWPECMGIHQTNLREILKNNCLWMFKTISKRQRKVKGPVQIKADLDLEANRWWAVYKTLLGKSSEFEHILCIRK